MCSISNYRVNDEGLALQLLPYFSRPIADVADLFLKMSNIDDLAKVLEVPKTNLVYIAYRKGLASQYKVFQVRKKSGGFREICMPLGGLRVIQQKLKKIFDHIDNKPLCSHAYHKGKSYLTNARAHRKQQYIFNMDLEDFFGTIHFGRVRGAFVAAYKLPIEVATFLAQICCFEGKLPQGAPTSPFISNIVAFNLDKAMVKLAKRYRLNYTRYADDLTFSYWMKNFPSSMAYFIDGDQFKGSAKVGAILEQEIERQGFVINHKKTRLQFKYYQQAVTGVVVNQFANVRRKKIIEVRRLIHLWNKFGLVRAEEFRFEKKEGGRYFKAVLFGNLGYIRDVRGGSDVILRTMCRKIVALTTDCPPWIKEAAAEFQVKDIFLSHASEDKVAVAEPLFNACQALGISVFYDAADIKWGDSVVEKINNGLGEAKIIVPVMSEVFLQKKWPTKELNIALARFMKEKSRILPIVHGLENVDDYPLLSDLHYKKWSDNADELAVLIKERLDSL